MSLTKKCRCDILSISERVTVTCGSVTSKSSLHLQGAFCLFRLIKFNLFYKKLLKCREINEYYDFYVISIFVLLYSLKETKNFRFIAKNDCCLFDIGLFALFLAKITELPNCKKKNLDTRLILAYISIYKKSLNTNFYKENDLTTVAFSRFELYNNVYNQKKDVAAIFNEFCKIVKVDISIETLVHFYTDVPLYLLDSFEKAWKCDCVCDTLFKQLIPSSFKTIPGIIEDAHKLKLL